MSSVTFNEFQRELKKRIRDPQVAYMMTLIYERLADCMKGQEECAKAVLAMAQNMQGFMQLQEMNDKRLQQLARGMSINDGIDVASVAQDPSEKN